MRVIPDASDSSKVVNTSSGSVSEDLNAENNDDTESLTVDRPEIDIEVTAFTVPALKSGDPASINR